MAEELVSQETIESILRDLVEVYNPGAVYLYGSYAWGKPNPYSDIDLCVILDYSAQSQAERIRKGLRKLKGTGYPVDILVLTKDEIKDHKDHPSTLIYKVLTHQPLSKLGNFESGPTFRFYNSLYYNKL